MVKKYLILSVILPICFFGCEHVKEITPAAENEHRKFFEQMLDNKAQEYRNARADLMRTDNFTAFIEQKLADGSKKEKLLARIILERSEKPELFSQVDKIMLDAAKTGTIVSPDDISYKYIRSRLLKLSDNPALPAIEHLMFESNNPKLAAAILQAVYIFEDKDMEYCFETLLDDKNHEVRMAVIDAIQRAGFIRLKPKLKALEADTKNAKEKQRIKRALSIMK